MQVTSKILNFLSLILIFAVNIHAQKIEYLKFIPENDDCKLNQDVYGTCKKISECRSEFEKFRKNKSNLIICNYGDSVQNSIICCPNDVETSKLMISDKIDDKPTRKNILDFKTCRNEFLKFRNSSINPNHFAEELNAKRLPINKENCDKLDQLNKMTKNFWDLRSFNCVKDPDGTYRIVGVAAYFAELVKRGDRPNMAAIGWTQPNKKYFYGCGGSIITEKFIVTAAHCKFLEKKQADTVRLGDRFLLTSEDDDTAQQLRIQHFILHPLYKSNLNYHDIAMIKTVETILFNKFVVPSCIDDLGSDKNGLFTEWTVAGYGETEDGVASNVLLELKVDLVSNEECNKTFEDNDRLPNGILDSQFCVKSQAFGGNVPDTCFGDSGSPLQFKTAYEVFPSNFNKTFISTMYEVSTVLGIVSFGVSCGLEVPSVYTKLVYYRDWMSSVVDTN